MGPLHHAPTSRPAADPNNPGFIYQRFQRGIMHFDAATGRTQGILLADYLKAILRGTDLPPDPASHSDEERAAIRKRMYNQRAMPVPA